MNDNISGQAGAAMPARSSRQPWPGTSAHSSAVQTNDFEESISHAKNLSNALPAGELNAEEQDEAISMLEEMRDYSTRGTQSWCRRSIHCSLNAGYVGAS